MDSRNVHQLYLKDLGVLIKDAALAARRAADLPAEEQSFQQGMVMAYYDVINTMQQQATAFGISDSDLGLSGFDPDRELLADQ